VFGRDGLLTTLANMLHDCTDKELDRFRLRFFKSVFHPNAFSVAPTLVDDKWLLQVQRSQLRRLFDSNANSARLQQYLEDAQQEFARILAMQPTLGLTPARWKELPGFVRYHAMNVARGLRRRLGGTTISDSARVTARNCSPVDEAILAEYRDRFIRFLHADLSELQREVILGKVLGGHTFEQTAELLQITVSQVRTAFENALRGCQTTAPVSWEIRGMTGPQSGFLAASYRYSP